MFSKLPTIVVNPVPNDLITVGNDSLLKMGNNPKARALKNLKTEAIIPIKISNSYLIYFLYKNHKKYLVNHS